MKLGRVYRENSSSEEDFKDVEERTADDALSKFFTEASSSFLQIGSPLDLTPDGTYKRTDLYKRGDSAGWYRVKDWTRRDGTPILSITMGDWHSGRKGYWTSLNQGAESTLTDEEKKERERIRMREAEEERKAEEDASAGAARYWLSLPPSAEETAHPYLSLKRIKAHGAKINNGRLVIPVCRLEDDGRVNIISIQEIYQDENNKKFVKKYRKGAPVYKGYFPIEGEQDVVFIAEGFATGASVAEATGKEVWCALSAGNLKAISNVVKKWRPNSKVIIAADHDRHAEGFTLGAGERYARDTGLPYIMPDEEGSDWNDFSIFFGASELRKKLLGERSQDGKPIGQEGEIFYTPDEFFSELEDTEWLIKYWVPSDGIVMIYGPPTSYKSFVAIDIAMHVASGIPSWRGEDNLVTPGVVVYLNGEGKKNFKKRVLGWLKRNEISHLTVHRTFHPSKVARYLNDPAGLEAVIRAIDSFPERPSLIVIDTLNMFFSGDENSAQEIGFFIHNVKELQARYNTAVIIVHHSKKNDNGTVPTERGSSAIRAAVDLQMSVTKDGMTASLKMTKNKDGEELEMALTMDEVELKKDKEGKPVTTLVPRIADRRELLPTKETEILIRAWLNGRRTVGINGNPEIAVDEIKRQLKSEGEDVKHAFYDRNRSFVMRLINAGVMRAISNDGNGKATTYQITNPAISQRMKESKE